MYIYLKEIKLPDGVKIEVSRVVEDGFKTVYVYFNNDKRVFTRQRGSNKQLIKKYEKQVKEILIKVALKQAGILTTDLY